MLSPMRASAGGRTIIAEGRAGAKSRGCKGVCEDAVVASGEWRVASGEWRATSSVVSGGKEVIQGSISWLEFIFGKLISWCDPDLGTSRFARRVMLILGTSRYRPSCDAVHVSESACLPLTLCSCRGGEENTGTSNSIRAIDANSRKGTPVQQN